MNQIRVQSLGPLTVTRADSGEPHLSNAVRQFIALLAASGPCGATRYEIAIGLWDEPLPESWKSAIRNRLTAARRALGADAISTVSDRLRFGDGVEVDSWRLIELSLQLPSDSPGPISFLTGEPFAGAARTPLIERHVVEIRDARAVLLAEHVSRATAPLAANTLNAIRAYQRLNPLDQGVSEATIRAHLLSGDLRRAKEIVEGVKMVSGQNDHEPSWIRDLTDLLPGTMPLETDRRDASTEQRSELFASAAAAKDWGLALEIAMNGLPAAERIDGDPERLVLFEAIPLDGLPSNQRFTYSRRMAILLVCVGREYEAREWSRTARDLATSPDEQLIAYITGSMVGDSADERTPIPLPVSFGEAADENVNMRSLQNAVVSHLERADYDQASVLIQQFRAMVCASAAPVRRWHMMVLESMLLLVNGELNAAADAASRAFSYGKLSNIADANVTFVGQLANASWIDPALPRPSNWKTEYSQAATSTLGKAIEIAFAPDAERPPLLHEFTQRFDFDSRALFNLPTLMIVAPYLEDADHRRLAMKRFQRRTGTSAIWGSGVHLGPVDRAIARLSTDDDERHQHLREAIAVADRQRTRLWQVVCRLDLAGLTGDGDLRRQAEELATTPELAQFIPRYPGLQFAHRH